MQRKVTIVQREVESRHVDGVFDGREVMDGRAGVMMVLDDVRLAALWRASTCLAQAHSHSRLPRLLRRARLALLPIPSNNHDFLFDSPTPSRSQFIPNTYATLPTYHTIMSDVDTPPVQEATANDQNPLADMEAVSYTHLTLPTKRIV